MRLLPLRPRLVAACAAALAGSALLLACGGGSDQDAPAVQARAKRILDIQGLRFKDLDGNGQLTPYEDWRLTAEARAADLVARMTLQEKAGMMLIQTLNAGAGGTVPAVAGELVDNQLMSRFILRNLVTGTPAATGTDVTPLQAAGFTNAIQEKREATRLGIPALFKSNARNHIDPDARQGINEAAGAFTAFPKEPGLAAAALGEGNMGLVKRFAEVMGAEWKAIGLRGMYGYMADLATEPRWYRVHETFTEDAGLASDIIRTLVQVLQGEKKSEGTSVAPSSAVALTLKHFPGGGPQEMGLDAHYAHGKEQVYPAGNFGYHLRPFMAAIEAGVSSVMPYYGVPINVTYEGVTYEQTGFAFSRQIVTDLLRAKLGFQGYVNSDTGVINDRAWGLEGKTVQQRVAAAINGGTEVLSGFQDKQVIIDLVNAGLVTQARVDEAVKRLLKEQFQLGLFENPYVDETKAAGTIGQAAHREVALEVQRKSLVLLQNQDAGGGTKVLPLKAAARVYVLGDFTKANVEKAGYTVTDGNVAVAGARPSAAGHDVALVSVTALARRSVTSAYRSDDPATGMNPAYVNPKTGKPYGASDRCVNTGAYADVTKTCLDNGLVFGGVLPWEADNLSFSAMAASQSWEIRPSLAEIRKVMAEVGAKKTVLHIYFRHPFVLDAESGLRDAGAIVAGFGASDTALLDVLSGRFKPQGKLPFALANNLQAVKANAPDAPGYPAADTLYPYGFGLTY